MAYANPYPQGINPSFAPQPASPPPAANPDAAYIAEVRASGQGKSEDYARFTDADLLSWKKYYQGGGKFKNDYGDIVDKPDERGPNTPGNRNGTGDQGDYGRGWNNSSLDSEGPATSTPTAPTDAPQGPNDPLQARLLEMYQGGEGAFAGSRSAGQDLAGGGVWWSGQNAPADVPTGVSPALAQAAMTAFTPSAPSAQGGGFTGNNQQPQPQAPVQSAVAPQVASTQPASSATPARIPEPAAPTGANPLVDAVQRRYRDPNSWWAGQKTY
jgi:hypothetical protein